MKTNITHRMARRIRSNHSSRSRQSGISLVESLVIMGIIAVVFAAATALWGLDRGDKFDGQVQNLVSDLRQMQSMARTVDNNKEYGISFTSNAYATFSRDPSSGNQTTIKTVDLTAATLAATLNPPASQLIFARLSGSPKSNTQATLTLSRTNPTRQKTIRVETSGAVHVQ